MQKYKITIERDKESGVFVASWDDPRGGGITTQAESLDELLIALKEAARCHFMKKGRERKNARGHCNMELS